ncbi:hypothetical protein Agabi119p4_9718 [Agaricus bisporus var. burnettii]|uniref:AIG1-type G domain-containing protein n=1 Tax=Agaricus bisporus var. burnettii TaxID=192524 RepID=A0A8H7EX32_AGABI|nr:hypothetical protein Agabi119p4_9718 [Agaricus bisporus var. burnettii]
MVLDTNMLQKRDTERAVSTAKRSDSLKTLAINWMPGFGKKEEEKLGLLSPRPVDRDIRSFTPIKPEDLTKNDVIIVIMGPTGAGKSTFIQTATPGYNNHAVGHGLQSFTSQITAVRMSFDDGTNVVLVDTPGFDDTCLSDFDILQTVAKWLKNVRTRELEISGILYLHRISDNRMAQTPLKNLKMFQKLCGEDFFKKVILVTTMWPELESTETNGIASDEYYDEMNSCSNREKELETIYWSDMLNHGSTTKRFSNSKDSAWDIIDCIIDIESQKRWVRIQEEMVTQGKKLPNTDAGRQLHGITQELIDRQNDLFKRMKEELGQNVDQMVVQALLEELKELQKDREKALEDMRQLDSRLLGSLRRWLRKLIPRKCSPAYQDVQDIDN